VGGSEPDLKCPYVRLSFAYATEEDLTLGVRRLGAALSALRSQQNQWQRINL
jgi:DNA-binding transcriptional MocR family regulator